MYTVGKFVDLKLQFGRNVSTVQGVVMVRPKWAKPTEIAIATGNPEFPMAIVDTNYVVNSTKTKAETTPSPARTFKVKSSENTYIVTYFGGKYSCTCIGFSFRKKCKHVDAVANKIQNG